VEHLAAEVGESGQVGHRRLGQHAVRRDQHVGAERAAGGVQQPAVRGRVPAGAADLVAEPYVAADAETVRGLPQVGQDLRLR
jgi:hypothetical protein